VAVLAVLVFGNSLANDFAYDDEFVVEDRELVHDLSNVPRLLTAEYWPESYHSGLYRPVTLLSFAVDWKFWSGRPVGFHLTNVLLHAAVSALVALLLLQLFPWWAALAGGIVFAVHPVHTEAVANIVGRGELLAGLFTLLACLIYTRAVRNEGLSPGAIVLIAISYAFACFSKEVGVILPGLLIAIDLALVRDGRIDGFRSYVRTRLPLFTVLGAMLLLVLGIRWAVLGAPLEHQPAGAFALDDSFPTRLFTMARVWPRYLELCFFPTNLSADYSPAVILPTDRLTALGALGFLMILGIILLAIASFRRTPEASMALAWAAVALLPVSNLLVVSEIVLAERTLYLPSVAVSMLAALLLVGCTRARRTWVIVGLSLWIVGFSVVTVRRNSVWHNTNSVFEDLRRRHPESSRLLFGVGYQFYQDGQWDQAREWFRRSIRMWPHNATHRADFAAYLADHFEWEEAESMVAGALELRPTTRDYYVLLASIRLRRGDPAGAVQAIDRALGVLGPEATLFTMQAMAYAQLGALESAILAQESAVRTRGGEPYWRDWLGLAQLRVAVGDTAGALAALREARLAKGAEPEIADSLEASWSPVP